jgi:hypothetical protein
MASARILTQEALFAVLKMTSSPLACFAAERVPTDRFYKERPNDSAPNSLGDRAGLGFAGVGRMWLWRLCREHPLERLAFSEPRSN